MRTATQAQDGIAGSRLNPAVKQAGRRRITPQRRDLAGCRAVHGLVVEKLRRLSLDDLVWLGDFAIDLVPAADEVFAKDAEIGRILHALNALPAATASRVLSMVD